VKTTKLLGVGVLILVLMFCLFQFISCKNNKDDFNIILISIDTLRTDHLSLYGYEYNTSPNIDEFSKKSIIFEYALCPIPKTSASVASMMTGLHPFSHGTKPNKGHLNKKYITLAECLKLKGYSNFAIVDNANLSKKYYFNQGFNSYREVWHETSHLNESSKFITEEALTFLRNNDKNPFFLWLHYLEPHAPYIPPQNYVEERPKGRNIQDLEFKVIVGTDHEKQEMKKNPYEGHFISLYDGSIRYVDAEIGKILKAFQEEKLHKNTIVIITSDHGEDLGEYNFYFDHGPLAFPEAARIPLIIYIPGQKSKRIGYPVSLMDLYPTLLKQNNLHLPYPIQGQDLFIEDEERSLFIYGLLSKTTVFKGFYNVVVFAEFAKSLGIQEKYLFNIQNDPLGKTDIIDKNLSLSKKMLTLYRQYFQDNQSSDGSYKQEIDEGLSKKEIEQLKALGYLK